MNQLPLLILMTSAGLYCAWLCAKIYGPTLQGLNLPDQKSRRLKPPQC